MKNLVELIRENITIRTDLERTMFEILENNIDGYDTLDEIKYYMEYDAICINGSVSGLIYYSETREVFKNNFEEIFELLEEYKEEVGTINHIELNYNNLVWFAFENLNSKWFSEIEDLEVEEEYEEEELDDEEII